MKAVLLEAFGGPENLVYSDHQDPKPGRGQALVRVRACALNHLDLFVRDGIPSYKIGLPHILGCDIAGEVLSYGPESTGPKVGTRVVICPGVSCGECVWCLKGEDSRCKDYGIIGAQGGHGGYAEMVVVPAQNLFPVPPGINDEQAASFPLTFLTAYHMLVTLAELKAGQDVLVLGAGSGVGVAGIQVAAACGARVIAASTSEEKLEAAKALGAHAVIHSPPDDLLRQTIKLTGGKGADVVFEHVGPAVFDKALRALAPGGALVTCGSTTGPVVQLDMRYVFSRELRILGAKMGSLAEFHQVMKLVAAGKLKPVVDATFPLEEARRAHEYLASRKQFGKVVLKI
ncbi:MAG: zinc-binding dehydrogenase [Elusimicrobia bacterium]|nr:zinc-binding dehydrogenase [Elusimicrobiota bacterium]